MKKIVIALVIAIALTGAVSAQPWVGQTPQTPGRGYAVTQNVVAPEKITIEGTLELVNGSIGLKQNGNKYYVMGLNRLIGFVDGLKEGAKVKLEGYALAIGDSKTEFVFHTLTLTIGDRTIDLSDSMRFGGTGMGGMGGRGFDGTMGGGGFGAPRGGMMGGWGR